MLLSLTLLYSTLLYPHWLLARLLPVTDTSSSSGEGSSAPRIVAATDSEGGNSDREEFGLAPPLPVGEGCGRAFWTVEAISLSVSPCKEFTGEGPPSSALFTQSTSASHAPTKSTDEGNGESSVLLSDFAVLMPVLG